MVDDILILRPFNAVFFGCIFLTVLAGIYFIKRNIGKTMAEKKKAVAVFYSVIFVFFIVYKILLSMDSEYSEICVLNGLSEFNWLVELPLNLCNINIILIVIGVLTGSESVLGFCFFFGSLGATLATVMPCIGFSGYSILLPRMLGFYVCHLAVILEMPILLCLGIYRPSYRNVPKAFLTLVSIATIMTAFNLVMRSTGLAPGCNYFYTADPTGIPPLELLYSWIPIPGIYMLPLYLCGLLPFMYLVTFLCKRKERQTN